MIDLYQAFKLCAIKDEGVYLAAVGEGDSHYFWSEKIIKYFDMRKIKVVRIELEFEHFGPDFLGYCFRVEGISSEELAEAEYNAQFKYK